MTHTNPLTIQLSKVKPLTKNEAKFSEKAYRRGYADGWIRAVNEMRPGQLYHALFSFWENTLRLWHIGKDQEHFEEPPQFDNRRKCR